MTTSIKQKIIKHNNFLDSSLLCMITLQLFLALSMILLLLTAVNDLSKEQLASVADGKVPTCQLPLTKELP